MVNLLSDIAAYALQPKKPSLNLCSKQLIACKQSNVELRLSTNLLQINPNNTWVFCNLLFQVICQ